MDQSGYQNLQNLTHQLKTSQSVKKITQFVVSVSLFSFLYSFSSSYYSFLFHSLKFYLSSLPFQITSKNCIFLIFNGILVFLAKTSGLLHSWSDFDPMEPKLIKKITDGLEMEMAKNEEFLVDINADLEEEVVVVKEEEEEVVVVVEEEEEEVVVEEERGSEVLMNEERKSSDLIVVKEDEEEKEENGLFSRGGKGDNGTFVVENFEEKQIDHSESGFPFEEEEDEEEEEEEEKEEEIGEEEMGRLSTEELNKKFDDFIRRMKEDIRIEAQQQLIMV